MADHGHAADIPQMDYPEHERTYTGFVHFAEVGTLLTLIGTGIGIAAPSIGWRATLVPFVLMLLALLLY
ncbi:MAG: aa3-type cytochrome c oxidase subunit IV [Comamonadaceae bacterium]|nr:MAG: aa3-type cytochrome c oxidase subunit IV [Comamonadaceae bacterium]